MTPAHRAGGLKMSSETESGGTRGVPTMSGNRLPADSDLDGVPDDGASIDRPRGKPGRKPRGSVPVPVPDLPDQPDPDHVLTWRQRKVLQVIRESVQRRGYPDRKSTRLNSSHLGISYAVFC